MVQIRGTEIFKSMSGIHFKREALSNKAESCLTPLLPLRCQARQTAWLAWPAPFQSSSIIKTLCSQSNALLGSRLWVRRELSVTFCQFGQLSVGTTVRGPTVSRPWTTVCQRKLSELWKTVRSYSCPLPNCRRKLLELWKNSPQKFKLYPVFISIPISQAATPGPRFNKRKKLAPATTSRC